MASIQNKLRQIFGPKCSAININGESDGFINVPLRELSICEAINNSFRVPIRITSGNLICLGARRSTGFENYDKKLIKEISSHSNISEGYITNAIKTIPFLSRIKYINLGLTESLEHYLQPDLYIMYVEPDKITDLIHNLAKLEIKPSIPPNSFLSVCGNVLVNCHLNRAVSISFGCPESRNIGGIGKYEVVLGLPAKIADELIKFYE